MFLPAVANQQTQDPLPLTSKMAPTGSEPKAPDKTSNKNVENDTNDILTTKASSPTEVDDNVKTEKGEDKQSEEKKDPDVTTLNDGQLKALLDEALTYKCPKDRVGKSTLFRELLDKAESDKTECGDDRLSNQAEFNTARYFNRRRGGRRDVSAATSGETKGGSLQNLVQALECENSYAFYTNSHGVARGRKSKKSGKDHGVSVSARQREGGSLPSNVNVGGCGMKTLLFEDLRGFDTPQYSPKMLKSKEPVHSATVGEIKKAKEFGFNSIANELKPVTNKDSDYTSRDLVSNEFTAIQMPDIADSAAKDNAVDVSKDSCNMEAKDINKKLNDGILMKFADNGDLVFSDKVGKEMEVLSKSAVMNYTTRASFEVSPEDGKTRRSPTDQERGFEDGVSYAMGLKARRNAELDVDSQVIFPLKDRNETVNGSDHGLLQLSTGYKSVQSVQGIKGQEERANHKALTEMMLQTINPTQHVSEMSTSPTKRIPWTNLAVPLFQDRILIPIPVSCDELGNPVHGWLVIEHRDIPKDTVTAKEMSLKRQKVNEKRKRRMKERQQKIYSESNFVSSYKLFAFGQNKNLENVSRLTFTTSDEKSKSYDENGNAVTVVASNSSGERKLKASKKAKPKANHKEYLAEQVTGHRGKEDIESLLKYIETDKERKNKAFQKQRNQRSNTILNDKGTKIRDRKLARSEDHSSENDKLKRSNSLEEISKTKLEDLTSDRSGVLRRPKKQSTFDDTDLRGDRRSWGTEEGQQYYCNDPSTADESFPVGRKKRRDGKLDNQTAATLPTEENEFLIVTKKQRRKKQRSSSGGRGNLFDDNRRSQYGQQQREKGDFQQRRGNNSGFPPHDRDVLYQYRRPRSPDLRRKSTSSMPPSDKSDSSDLDSVHSLPISSTTPKSNLDQSSASSNSTPLASYADIARSSSAAPTNINVNATKWPAITCNSTHNPQFITSSKINIGVPPVSGSRLHTSTINVVSSNATSNDTLSLSNIPAGPASDELSKEPEEMVTPKARADPRTKKSAVASVSVNFKTIPPYENTDQPVAKQIVEDSSNKSAKNIVLLEDMPDDKKTRVSPAIIYNDLVLVEKQTRINVHHESVEDMCTPVIDLQGNAASAVVPTRDTSDVDVAKSDLSDNKGNNTKRINDSLEREGKRVNINKGFSPLSLSSQASNPRPAVIILDEKESVSVSENLTSEITFGFEINELLLMSDEENNSETSCLNSASVDERTVRKGQNVSPKVSESKPRLVLNKSQKKNTNKASADQLRQVGNKEQNVAPDASANHLHEAIEDGQGVNEISENQVKGVVIRERTDIVSESVSTPHDEQPTQNEISEESVTTVLPQALAECIITSEMPTEQEISGSKASEDFAARYRAPIVTGQLSDHEALVNFIGHAWDSVVSHGGGTFLSDL